MSTAELVENSPKAFNKIVLTIRQNRSHCTGTHRYFDADGFAKVQVVHGFLLNQQLVLIGQHTDKTYSVFKKIANGLAWMVYSLTLEHAESFIESFSESERLSLAKINNMLGQNKVFQV
jgi:ABC-type enterochelin transport system substrate-binding protein